MLFAGRTLYRIRHEVNILISSIVLIITVVLFILIDYWLELLLSMELAWNSTAIVWTRGQSDTVRYHLQILLASYKRELIFQGGTRFCRFQILQPSCKRALRLFLANLKSFLSITGRTIEKKWWFPGRSSTVIKQCQDIAAFERKSSSDMLQDEWCCWSSRQHN